MGQWEIGEEHDRDQDVRRRAEKTVARQAIWDPIAFARGLVGTERHSHSADRRKQDQQEVGRRNERREGLTETTLSLVCCTLCVCSSCCSSTLLGSNPRPAIARSLSLSMSCWASSGDV